MNKNNEFIKLYNNLDNIINSKFHIERATSGVYYLITRFRKSQINKEKEYADSLDVIRQVRNIIVHESGVVDHIFEVSEDLILELKEITRYVEKPIRSKDIMTPFKDLIVGTLDTTIKEAIKLIYENGVSNIPIINEYHVIQGVFNSDVLVSLLARNVTFNKNYKMEEILDYIKLENQINLRFLFVDEKIEINEVKDYFENSKAQYKKRLPIIFVNEKGKMTLPLKGIIAPIDLLKS